MEATSWRSCSGRKVSWSASDVDRVAQGIREQLPSSATRMITRGQFTSTEILKMKVPDVICPCMKDLESNQVFIHP
eukprot:7558122-Alexandrium_andersonii.AAC.2